MSGKIYSGIDGYSLYLSNDLGENWIEMKNGLNSISANALLAYDNNLFVGTDNYGVYLTTNNGITWSTKNTGFDYLHIRCLSNIGNTIVAATYFRGIFITNDFGNNWVERNKGLLNRRMLSLASDKNYIFAGTNDGIFLSTDKGDNWKSVNLGLLKIPIISLTIIDEYIYAGTNGRGIFVAKLSDFVTTEINEFEDNENKLKFYPNPTSNYITVQIQDSKGSKVQIFDVLGIEVHSESIHPMTGSHRMNIEHLPAGVYFIKIGDRFEKFVKM
jgi:hypothetical protein